MSASANGSGKHLTHSSLHSEHWELRSAKQRSDAPVSAIVTAAAVRHPTMSTPVLSFAATTVAAYYVVSICIALLVHCGYTDYFSENATLNWYLFNYNLSI